MAQYIKIMAVLCLINSTQCAIASARSNMHSNNITPFVPAQDNNFTQNSSFDLGCIAREKNPNKILNFISSIPKDKRNEHDNQGKTIAHYFFRVQRDYDPIQEAIDLGVDFKKQTVAPDKYPGSTVAHDLAGTLINQGHQKLSPDQLQRLSKLWKIDNGAHFELESAPNNYNVWSLLAFSGFLLDFINSLPNKESRQVKYKPTSGKNADNDQEIITSPRFLLPKDLLDDDAVETRPQSRITKSNDFSATPARHSISEHLLYARAAAQIPSVDAEYSWEMYLAQTAAQAAEHAPVLQNTPVTTTAHQPSYPANRMGLRAAISEKAHRQTIMRILRSMPQEELNSYSQRHLTVAHDLLPICLKAGILETALKSGVDLTKPSDQFCRVGSYTLAHSVARGLSRFNKEFDRQAIQARLNCLVKLSFLDDGKHFFIQSNEGSVWDFLRQNNQLEAFHELHAKLHPDTSICLD